MTLRHRLMLTKRLSQIVDICSVNKTDPERVSQVIRKYRVETEYKDLAVILGYMPDSILDAITEELE